MNDFEYASPASLDEAIGLLSATHGETALLGGGTDLLNQLKEQVAHPKRIVNLKKIDGLSGIDVLGTEIRIGACARIEDVARHEAVKTHFPALSHAIHNIDSPQIRNMATVGGNLCQRPRCWYFRNGFGLLAMRDGESLVPKGDNRYHAIFGTDSGAYYICPSSMAPVLTALDAMVTVRGPEGAEREIAAANLYNIPRSENESELSIAANEIVAAVSIPIQKKRNGLYKVRQRQIVDWPLVQAVVTYSDDNGTARDVRVVLGFVAPIPWEAKAAAQALEGKKIDADVAKACGEAAAEGAQPLSRNGYKIRLVKTAVKRAVLDAAGIKEEA